MAINNWVDYSKAPLLDSPAKTIFEDVLKGYKMSKEPEKMKEEQSARELANKLKKIDVEHKPKENELNDQQKSLANAMSKMANSHYEEKYTQQKELNQSIINKNNRPAGTSASKFNGQVANADAIWKLQHPEGDVTPELKKEHEDSLKNAFKVSQEHVQTMTDRTKDIIAGGSFDHLPVNDKKQAIGLMKAMGVDPVTAVSMLRSGLTPSEYAKQNDIDITKVTPDYSLGEQNIKIIQQASAYMDEIDGLDKHINDSLGDYQNKIKGYSFDEIADSLKGDKPDKVGRALAARALLPELMSLRLKISGANIGIEALRELEEKSLGSMKIIEGLVDKPTFIAAQKYMREWINEAGHTRIKALENYGHLKTREEKSATNESGGSFNFSDYPVAGGK